MARNYNLTGKLYWAKVFGAPVETYQGDAEEWTLDVTPDQRGIELLNRIGLGGKLRNKDDDREDFITFRRAAINKTKNVPNNHIEVVDSEDNPWDEQAHPQLGNGTIVKVKFNVFQKAAQGKFKEIIKPVIFQIKVIEFKAPPVKKPVAGTGATAPAPEPSTDNVQSKSVQRRLAEQKPAAKDDDWQNTSS